MHVRLWDNFRRLHPSMKTHWGIERRNCEPVLCGDSEIFFAAAKCLCWGIALHAS